jgi:hypothetical protein
MTRIRHVASSQTVQRIAKLHRLITALLSGPQDRDALGDLLKVGPSGVRKYLADLRGKVELIIIDGRPHYRLAISAEATRDFLERLAAQMPVRAVKEPKSPMQVRMAGVGRHFHILADDTHYAIRVNNRIPAHFPLMAHFFNLVPAGVWV